MSYLPQDYKPSSSDIMCGRGVEIFQHPANIFFREIVMRYLPSYEAASSKREKSAVVQDIIQDVRSHSPDGVSSQFIRKDTAIDIWLVLNSVAVRQKVGQTLREMKTSLDPVKRKALAEKRAQYYKIRRNSKAMRDDSSYSSSDSSSASTSASLMSELEDEGSPLPGLSHTQSLPTVSRASFLFPTALLLHRSKSDCVITSSMYARKSSIDPEELALSSLPVTFSSDWFDASTLSFEDADLTDSIDSLFDDEVEDVLVISLRNTFHP